MSGTPVEIHLDRLFDLLAGTGGTGRRILNEAEAHLNDSAGALIAQGHAPHDAMCEAVLRFGPPELVAKAVLQSTMLPFSALLQRIVAAAWLLGAVGLSCLGLSGLFAWLVGKLFGAAMIAPDAPGQIYAASRCANLLAAFPGASGCYAASVAHHFEELVYRPLAAGALGIMLLALFWVSRRIPIVRGLTVLPPKDMIAAVGLTAFGGAAAVLSFLEIGSLFQGVPWGVGADFARAGAALLAAFLFVPQSWNELRRGTV